MPISPSFADANGVFFSSGVIATWIPLFPGRLPVGLIASTSINTPLPSSNCGSSGRPDFSRDLRRAFARSSRALNAEKSRTGALNSVDDWAAVGEICLDFSIFFGSMVADLGDVGLAVLISSCFGLLTFSFFGFGFQRHSEGKLHWRSQFFGLVGLRFSLSSSSCCRGCPSMTLAFFAPNNFCLKLLGVGVSAIRLRPSASSRQAL